MLARLWFAEGGATTSESDPDIEVLDEALDVYRADAEESRRY